MPNSLTEIGGAAFKNCSKLQSIKLPRSINTIRAGVFYGCAGLKQINISNQVFAIENNAFGKCTALDKIVFDGTSDEWKRIRKTELSDSSWNTGVPSTCMVYCNDESFSI